MNKKVIKVFAIGAALMAATSPIMSIPTNTQYVQASTLKQRNKQVSMLVYKYSKNHKSRAKSMARSFVGSKAVVTIKAGYVTKMTIHVNGANNSMGKGQDVNNIVKSLKINGVNGHKENVSTDHSNFDFVFSGRAFKNNGWAKMNVTINFGSTMHEQAWVKFGKVGGLKSKAQQKKDIVTKHYKKVSKKRR